MFDDQYYAEGEGDDAMEPPEFGDLEEELAELIKADKNKGACAVLPRPSAPAWTGAARQGIRRAEERPEEPRESARRGFNPP